jgi:hypothetical protein
MKETPLSAGENLTGNGEAGGRPPPHLPDDQKQKNE